jgi:hypothetical protein
MLAFHSPRMASSRRNRHTRAPREMSLEQSLIDSPEKELTMQSTMNVEPVRRLVALAVCALLLGSVALAQEKTKPTKMPPAHSQDMRPQPARNQERLDAVLVDPATTAKEKTATVQVKVSGVKLIDPAMTNKRVTPGQGHIHYQIDGGPVIATTATKLSFHELKPGKHTIVVMLANNDHSPAGPQKMLEITVP